MEKKPIHALPLALLPFFHLYCNAAVGIAVTSLVLLLTTPAYHKTSPTIRLRFSGVKYQIYHNSKMTMVVLFKFFNTETNILSQRKP